MQLGANADGALLQRALEGQPVDAPEIAPLVAVVREIEALDSYGLAPRADFVDGLRQRLLEEPALGALGAASAGASGLPDGTRDRGPAVVRFGRRSRILVAAAAVLLVLAGGLGALSRSALPGDRLYPVKQLLDRVALEVQREPLGLGLTHLAQAREHVSDTEQLLVRAKDDAGAADRDGAGVTNGPDLDPGLDAELATALDAATQSSTDGHTVLLDAYRTLREAEALTALADYYAEVVPAVDALRDQPLPGAAAAAWQRLHDVLTRDRDSTLRELAACTVCGDASAGARSLLAREIPTTSPGGAAPSATSRTTAGSAQTGGSPTSTTAPSRSGSAGSAKTSGGSAAVSSPPAGGVRLPTVGVSSTGVSAGGGGVTVPGATVSLPGVGVDTSGATIGGGGVTLPGATVSVPTVTVPLPNPLP
ncbi:hypothetical protein FHX52_4655 [Humibacillus xanthopallidus]|uniref:DUF5667 domain-containing protein n=1 Tax=Humibacillus xanthopallidus TaxID=412689 RepID=A0A543PMU9_9MICO|nr:hypothetical protein [Humibacillus xanthopallidus]TQN45415.1 hypothetical protein FHX52_4655 [Humibacillus xanthopallidus]